MKKIYTLLCPIVLGQLIGCAGPQTYTGILTDCSGNPMPNTNIEAWRNQWMPGRLAEKVGEAETNDSGEFVLNATKKANFFVYPKCKLNVSSHPRKSESNCENNGT